MKLPLLFTSVLLGTGLFINNNDPGALNKFSTETKKRIVPGKAGILPIGTVYIIIDKSDYELNVYDDKGWYATYPVVFGNSSLADKKMEGDRCTPEGNFHIVSKKIHDKWDRFMALDYPTRESYEKFRMRKLAGEIPANARIGGGVGIHGTWPHDDYIIDRYKNWTMGCISMKNKDVEDLYSYLPVGTRVTIRK
jgi:lipoprotein-anchoring transpeptidase ErfK/SrfK